MGTIHLLPALPEAWPAGSVTGMRVRGGFDLDMEWKDSSLVTATLRNISSDTGECDIRYRENTSSVRLDRCEFRTLQACEFLDG